jgi:CDP-diacylglycerol--glycerol-3-phosphate 3-phosphatidyltransferase/cardiolipin synthase
LASALRFLAIPFVITYLRHGRNLAALVVFAAAGLSDVLDGYLARKMGARSSIGAYIDVFADFALILSVYLFFCAYSTVHVVPVLLIVFMFAQFLLTSRGRTLVYDPVGKSFGAILFASIVPMLLFPHKPVTCVSCYIVTVAAAVSVSTRIAFLYGRWMQLPRLR